MKRYLTPLVLLGAIFIGALVGATVQGDFTAKDIAAVGNLLLTGKFDMGVGSVDDDDCTGEQGWMWWDSTDSAFEACLANSGAPTALGAGGGTPLYLFDMDLGNSSAVGSYGSGQGGDCIADSGVVIASGGDLIAHGSARANATGNEGVSCRGRRINSSDDLTNLTVDYTAAEYVNDTNNWVLELQIRCYAEDDNSVSWTTEDTCTVTGDTGVTTDVRLCQSTGVDISDVCNSGEYLLYRLQVGSGSTSTNDIALVDVAAYTP